MSKIRFTVLLFITVISPLFAWSGVPQSTPFIPKSGASNGEATVVTSLSHLEIAGVTILGKETLISIHDGKNKKSYWIPVGGTRAGIEVVSYNAKNNSVVVKYGQELASLTLRIAANGNKYKSSTNHGKKAPTLEEEYGRPLTVEEQETEARMLVSDLLEIGMEERARQQKLREKRQNK